MISAEHTSKRKADEDPNHIVEEDPNRIVEEDQDDKYWRVDQHENAKQETLNDEDQDNNWKNSASQPMTIISVNLDERQALAITLLTLARVHDKWKNR